MIRSARSRAKKQWWEFSITEDDFEIPDYCPILGLKLEHGTGRGPTDTSPTLDRIDNSKGYVPGNVQVISCRANRLKWDASPEELVQLAQWILSNVAWRIE